MIDSDQQAWLGTPEGIPLSLEEMRERYIADAPMVIHPLFGKGQDFNHGYYCSYWAKNLYWFICWEETGYDKETLPITGRSIILVPPGFTDPNAKKEDIHTTDAKRFWAAPDSE